MSKKRKRKTCPVPPHMREDQDYVKLNLAASLPQKKREQFINMVEECSASGFPASVLRSLSHRWVLVKTYKVVGVYDSPSKQRRNKKRGKKQGRTEQVFHGTAHRNVASIVATQFRLPNHYGMFGKAIYLSPEIRKCFGYTGGWSRTGQTAYILVCSVAMGKTYNAKDAINDMDPEKAKAMGYDTVIGLAGRTKSNGGGSLYHTEYAVYDPSRIKVTHILQYQVGNSHA